MTNLDTAKILVKLKQQADKTSGWAYDRGNSQICQAWRESGRAWELVHLLASAMLDTYFTDEKKQAVEEVKDEERIEEEARRRRPSVKYVKK